MADTLVRDDRVWRWPNVHGTENYAQLRKPAASICLDCHGPSPNGPQTATIEEYHTHHAKGSAGGECVACHMPKTGNPTQMHALSIGTPSCA